MILREELEAQGAVLFRWRSFVPFVILPVVVSAALSSETFADGHAAVLARLYDLCCILISFAGLAVRAYTVACAAPRTSGRNTKEQRADSLNTSGVYSIVRNPLYLGNFIMFLGMLLFIKVWWLIVIATLAYVLYYERIVLAEERFLIDKFGQEYLDWADRTPAMIPVLRLWRRPDCKFSLRIVLRREYNGMFLIVAIFYLLEWADRLLFKHIAPDGIITLEEAPGIYWTSFFLFGALLFVVLRSIKKHTTLLNERTA